MNKYISICIALCLSAVCYAQGWEVHSDSLAMVSRAKADTVLSMFDKMSGRKILYSLQDIAYYVIVQCGNDDFKEYVVKLDDSCDLLSFSEVSHEGEVLNVKNKRKYYRRMKEERRAIINAFNPDLYSTELITSVTDATMVKGVPSYFVMKDENNKRYGEYRLPMLTLPCPIDPSIYGYLIRELTMYSADNSKAP